MANRVTAAQLTAWGYGELVAHAARARGKNPRAKSVDDDGMNRTERAYANHLAALKLGGDIRDWKWEPFRIKLAGRTFLKPDFLVWLNDRSIEVHEIKGYLEDDAAAKIKVAADQHPWFRFWLVYREGGSWVYRAVTRAGIGARGEWSK